MSDAVVDLLARGPAAEQDRDGRLYTLLELLDRPDRAAPVVWVDGVHGKSSVVAMIGALLAALDVTAGTMTSPHLQDLRERLRIAGTVIGSDALREQLTYLDPFLREVDARYGTPLGFNEVMFALGATWFADAPVDVVVCEGEPVPSGRVDLTVTLDGPEHTGVERPDGEAVVLGDGFASADREVAVGGQRLTLRGAESSVSGVYLPLHGRHQADNAATAFAAVERFVGFGSGVDDDLVRQAFARVRLPGRLEVVRRPDAASVVLDGARDATSAAALAIALRDEFAVRHRIGVLGVAGGDATATVAALAGVLDHVVVVSSPSADAGSIREVAAAVRTHGLPVEEADSVDRALESASGVAGVEDVVVVAGGLQTAGHARRALGLDPVEDLLGTE